jgi:hypothetical protein
MMFGLIASIGLAATAPLEWNVRWPTDVPYDLIKALCGLNYRTEGCNK